MRKSRLKLVGSGGAGNGSDKGTVVPTEQGAVLDSIIHKNDPLSPSLEVQALSVPRCDVVLEMGTSNPASLGDRVRQLQHEARSLALQQVTDLEQSLLSLCHQSKDIAEGGDAYPVGARELARKLAADLPPVIQSLQVILRRQVGPGRQGKTT